MFGSFQVWLKHPNLDNWACRDVDNEKEVIKLLTVYAEAKIPKDRIRVFQLREVQLVKLEGNPYL